MNVWVFKVVHEDANIARFTCSIPIDFFANKDILMNRPSDIDDYDAKGETNFF